MAPLRTWLIAPQQAWSTEPPGSWALALMSRWVLGLEGVWSPGGGPWAVGEMGGLTGGLLGLWELAKSGGGGAHRAARPRLLRARHTAVPTQDLCPVSTAQPPSWPLKDLLPGLSPCLPRGLSPLWAWCLDVSGQASSHVLRSTRSPAGRPGGLDGPSACPLHAPKALRPHREGSWASGLRPSCPCHGRPWPCCSQPYRAGPGRHQHAAQVVSSGPWSLAPRACAREGFLDSHLVAEATPTPPKGG